MASLVYNSMLDDLVKGAINFNSDTFKVMLVTSAYTPNKDTHTRKNQVTNEVTGTGYTAGGQASAVTITPDTTNDREDLSFATVTWTSATITARAAVIYKDTGTASTSPLVAYVDFGSDVSSTNANFAVSFSSPLRFQN
ncbi:hypothetical protein HOU03_gp133 [Caulobacter phage CcrSC]|uniref:Uncharacterized protein n=1 Tax=Caulobacter phage CcrSC TaxID=2283272 RepID=A0A385EFB7_9CAUD|nr:hypothetical protein HOU03_gp133 [Caulobacter phage CcrSC]UTU07810.1 hypothetical protein CcrC1_gp125 [Caulobacter phage C1]UTU08354.1 hypothetical protein CcrC2_gp126 [Caulobacter phage C2]UTU08871.1 hypothetical protein CcrJ4_gp120 [Caulobacter phage J4]UTU09426.1 hypothetical protein CcrBL47_gp140 [Caulobacter phage BL47]UTU09987.1 hypothetical protein CcrRB23_gp125 [Caulobacter phage RB23]WGN97012.1 hypothetical protein [Bertelyvirus sp.]